MRDLVICGAGGLGREILSLTDRINAVSREWNVLGFIDDAKAGKTVNGKRVFDEKWLLDYPEREVGVVFGFADCKGKERLYQRLKKMKKIFFPSLIAPTSTVDALAAIGEGCVIADFCFVSIDVSIGFGVLLNVGTTVGHDSAIGNFSTVMPSCSVSGNVRIGERVLLGAGSFILQGKNVGRDAVVAAGSSVFWDVDEGVTVFGSPAYALKKQKKKEDEK